MTYHDYEKLITVSRPGGAFPWHIPARPFASPCFEWDNSCVSQYDLLTKAGTGQGEMVLVSKVSFINYCIPNVANMLANGNLKLSLQSDVQAWRF